MRRPSAVTVISIFFFQFVEIVHLLDAFLQLGSLSFPISCLASKRFSPVPVKPVPRLLRVSARISEVAAHRLLYLRLAAAQEPQHDEQRHHGGDKVGIGNLPRAAVMAAMAAFFLDDDDGRGRHDAAYPAAAPVAAAPPPPQRRVFRAAASLFNRLQT
jgi:hypothetical protein